MFSCISVQMLELPCHLGKVCSLDSSGDGHAVVCSMAEWMRSIGLWVADKQLMSTFSHHVLFLLSLKF